jgi:hypothetical protein
VPKPSRRWPHEISSPAAKEAAAGEEEEERAEASTPGSPQTPAHARGQRGSGGVGDELQGLEHRVLPDERVVEAREQGDETEQRGTHEGCRE